MLRSLHYLISSTIAIRYSYNASQSSRNITAKRDVLKKQKMTNFSRPPPASNMYLTSFPREGVLQVTLSRPKQLNSVTSQGHWDLHELFEWFEHEPSLPVAVVTGSGDKSFCAGQDLIEWEKNNANKPVEEQPVHPPSGFGGISQRRGRKVIIAAVNGYCFGGGVEIILNCDLILASPRATFCLPEATRGLWVAAGGLARLASIAGMPVATELTLTGRIFTPTEAAQWRLINRVSKSHESLLPETIELAGQIADLSPDAVFVTKAGLREYWENANVHEATRRVKKMYHAKLMAGENLREGLLAFKEKRPPRWTKSSL